MPRTVGDGGRRNVRRYVYKKRSSAGKSKSRYVLQQRRAASDWACIPQSRRGFAEPDWREEQAAAQAPEARRTGRGGAAHRAYDADDYGDYYYDADELPADDYEPEDESRLSRTARARCRPDILSPGTMVFSALIMFVAVIAGMVAEGSFGVLSALVTGVVSSVTAVTGWVARVSTVTLVGSVAVTLAGVWMIAKAVRLQRTYHDEPGPRRRVLVSKETLDRYF